jgi:hypothetical protein
VTFFRKIKAGLVKDDIENFVGDEGNVFFNVETGEFRLSDGVTPGGIGIGGGGGGGGTYTLPTASTTVKGGVKIDGTTITINNQVISGFSGSYTDLTNKPLIPTNTSQLNNNSGFITSSSLTWSNITGKPTLALVATSGSYADLTNKPTLFSGSYADLTNKPTLFSGSYADLTNKPTIPTNTNQLTNGAGFITSSALTGYALTSSIPPPYSLPIASTTILGGIKVDGTTVTITEAGVISAAGTSTVTGLNDLTDVDTVTTPPSNGQTLVYNSASNQWRPGAVAANSGSTLIKTFNILNEFTAPLLGKATFVPLSANTIRRVVLTNGEAAKVELTVGLYRNNELLNFFVLPVGSISYGYSGLNYPININDYLTVNVVNGGGINFNLQLLNE